MKKLSQTLRIVLAIFVSVFSNGLLPAVASALTPPNPTTPTADVTICHASNSNSNPYIINSPDTSGLGVGGGNGDHATHTGPIWFPGINEKWGDIIPPFTDLNGRYFAGLNWDSDGQQFYANNCNIPSPTQPTATAVVTPCSEPGTTDTVTISVTNPNDVDDATVTYTITFAGQTKTLSVADGGTNSVVFSGLAAGTYAASVTGSDGTSTSTANVTVAMCQTPTPAQPGLTVYDPKCSLTSLPTGAVSASVTNTADNTHAAVTYTWQIKQGTTVIESGTTGAIADGESDTINSTIGLAAGNYTMVVIGSDETNVDKPFTVASCEPTPVTPVAPAKIDACYKDMDFVSIPDTEGVVYKINGEVVTSPVFSAAQLSSVTVTAEAAPDYVLSGETGPWPFTFTDEQCLQMTKTANTPTDTNGDGKIGVGDVITWDIVVKNISSSDSDLSSLNNFLSTLTDEGATFQEGIYTTGFVPAGYSVTIKAMKPITAADVAACKATNAAKLSSVRYFPRNNERVETQAPLTYELTATGEINLKCEEPGHVLSETTVKPVAQQLPAELPATGGENNYLLLGVVLSTLTYFVVLRRQE